MAQMPEEGRKFGIVDSYWKDIMSEAVSQCVWTIKTDILSKKQSFLDMVLSFPFVAFLSFGEQLSVKCEN